MRKKRKKVHSYLSAYLASIMFVTPLIPVGTSTAHAHVDGNHSQLTEVIEEEISSQQESEMLDIQHTPPKDFIQGEPITIDVKSPKAKNILLHYSTESETNSIVMASEVDGTFTVTIPDSVIQSGKLEYWFSATNNENEVTTKPFILDIPEKEVAIEKPKKEELKEPTEEPSSEQTVVQEDEPSLQQEIEELPEVEIDTENPFEILHQSFTEIIGHEDLLIEADIPHATKVKLYFQTDNQLKMEELQFTRVEDTDTFNVTIPNTLLWSSQFNYQIHAEDEAGNTIETEWIKATVEHTDNYDTQDIAPLLITEITPDSDNVGGSDAYEFIEIYNNTNQPINISDYNLIYQYPDGRTINWDLIEDKEIGPEESFIVWIHNGKNNHLTVDDFNQHYGTSTTEDNFTIIENAGMANGSERTLIIADDEGNSITEATYNDSGKEVLPNQGIMYQFPLDGIVMNKVGVNEQAEPGIIHPSQVPSSPVEIEITEEPDPIDDQTSEAETGSTDEEPVEYDPQSVPRLLITEIVPNTVNMNGADAYEFIEIYNNSDQPINIGDYQLTYRYPTSSPDQLWKLTEDKVIEPQENFIVWIHNAGNKEATLADFSNEYGLNLQESHVTIIENDGMANGSERTLILEDAFGNEITKASYNDGSNDVYEDRGILYKFPTEGNTMEKMGPADTVTPLEVLPEQVPNEPVQIITEAEAPKIGRASFNITDEEYVVQVEVTSEQPIQGVNLQFRQSESVDFESQNMTSENGATYSVSIPKEDIWSDQIQYYFNAANQVRQTATEVETLEIPKDKINYQDIPPLLITEVVPDTANENGADAYEFIEIYNNTTEDINFNDYIIRYRYPNTAAANDLLWGSPLDHEEITIPSGETIVLWVINGGNPHLNGEDFNAHFGTNLIEGQNLIKIYNNGMANGSERTLVIATQTGDELSYVHYNEVTGLDDTVADKGIFYRFPENGNLTSNKISAGMMDATPGTIFKEQVPIEKVSPPADKEDPVIIDTTEQGPITSEEAFQISATVTDNIQVKSVSLHYRTMDGSDFNKVSLERGENHRFTHTVYEPELIGQKEVEYYFVVSDGKNIVQTDTKKIEIEHPNAETGLRLNLGENELLSGEKVIKATGDYFTEDIEMYLDNQQVTDTFMAMENEAYFAFDVTETNIFFKNGVVMEDEILSIFDDTYNNFVTLTVPIPADKLQIGENTISIRAGNKVSPFDEESEENRDDFTIKNIRLVLSDGTIIYDPNYANPNTSHAVGDSAGKQSVFDFTFTLEKEKFTSLAYLFDTTTIDDGEHEVRTMYSEEEAVATVITDNTAPTILPTIEEGKEYKGEFTIDATFEDVNGIEETTATLDGKFISLPYETSSAQLKPGEHEVVFTAIDKAGNRTEMNLNFDVTEEHPWLPDWLKDQTDHSSANLSVRVTDPTNDKMDVGFYKAYQYTAEDTDHLDIGHHAVGTEPPQSFEPEGESTFAEDERNQLIEKDGEEFATESMTEFPYHRFDITVDEDVDSDDEIEIIWNGSSLEGRKVTMYAWNYTTGQWDALTSTIAGKEDFELVGSVQGIDYLNDGKVSVIVQDQIAEFGEDFTFVWFTDTQYYSASYPWIYEDQVNWMVENQDALNIEYIFHTGDLVDVFDDFDQWKVADENMKRLDEAGIPYGVLAGNHDVDMKENNYENYYTYFGANRFEDRPYYGDSYENNRGHYDLISVNGMDFIMVYMGWGVDQAGIDWMNEVLDEHPNHIAILNFHEYLLATGTRSPIGDELFEKVVLPNENVKAVLAGHYHNAQTLIDDIDDDGDGEPDRTVYQMLADYQGGPEGGQGYLRVLNFDMDENQVNVQTYSPYLDDYNYYDVENFPGKDEFTMEWDLEPKLKKVATDYIEVNVYTDMKIGLVENVPSGETATVTWDSLEPESEYFWYTIAMDDFGGSTRSEIWNFNTEKGNVIIPEEDLQNESDSENDHVTETDPEDDSTIENGSNESLNETKDDSNDHSEEDTNNPPIRANDNTGGSSKVISTDADNKEKTTNNKEKEKDRNTLPNTATTIFNYLLLGITLLISGGAIWFIYRKKRFI